MKIAVVADLHLNKSVYKGVMDEENPIIPFRNADFMRSFKYICNLCIEEIKPDLMVIAGDVYENHNPNNEIRGFFSEQLSNLSKNKIPVVILVGNHDICKKHHALSDIQRLKLTNIKVIEKPTSLMFKDVKLLLFPYTIDVEQKKIGIKEEFYKFIKENQADEKSMFFGHFGVRGGKINEYKDKTHSEIDILSEKKSIVNTDNTSISLEDLDSIGCKYVFLGDYHRFQVLPTKKCIAMYCGSIEKTDISEIDQEKGFLLYDSDIEEQEKSGKVKFINYPGCRPMVELSGNFEKIIKSFERLDKEKYKKSIVKISFCGTEKQLIDYASEINQFKKRIEETISPIYIYDEQNIENSEMEKKSLEIEEEILKKGHIDENDVIKVFCEMISEKIEESDERDAITDLMKEIYQEAISNRKNN